MDQSHQQASPTQAVKTRYRLLQRIDTALELPMVFLAFVWLALLVLDLVYGLSDLGQKISDAIWVVFIIEFALRFILAPRKRRFLAKNWITALALLLPALRILRPLRLLQVTRGTGVIRVVGTLNRSMRALTRTMGRRGFGFVAILTILVCFAGAAGMYAFERGSPAGGFKGYGDALWWTAMTLTTLGAAYTPATVEGRVLTFLIALYGFSVFGYLAATLASFFVERDAASPETQTVGREDIEQVLKEIQALREEIQARDQKDAYLS